jgi:two-component system phosphate regulon sensor histidine kinase PhoR
MTSEIEKYEEFHVNVPYQELKPFAQTIWNQHENISQQLKELEKSERIRQEFTANVSHELKTPLTSISGYAELIENGMTKTEDLSRFGSEIRKNATRLLHLINDILELSELDEADIDVVKEPVDLYEIAKKCVELLVLSARKHQVNLTLTGSKSIVNANKDMMEELINNLCDNAIRYNRPGGSVNVNIYKDGEFTKLVVKDTGIGIPKEHLERIFERFYRVDKSRSKETGGTGLGLAIVKHIVAKHGEQLHIESEVGVGTVITIEL